MLTGNVELTGRLALFVEFLDRRDMAYGDTREVADADVARLLAAGFPREDACGFRFFTRIIATADVGKDGVEMCSEHVETSPVYLVGTLVSRAYLVSRAANPPSFGISGLYGIIGQLDRTPGARVIRFGSEDRHYRVIGPEDVVVDLAGNPVTEALGPPDGWVQPTEFVGNDCEVEIAGRLITTSVRSTCTDGSARVRLSVLNSDRGLPERIFAAARTDCAGTHNVPGDGWCNVCDEPTSGRPGRVPIAGLTAHHREGVIQFAARPEPTAITIDLGEGRSLRLSWNGTAMTVVLTDT